MAGAERLCVPFCPPKVLAEVTEGQLSRDARNLGLEAITLANDTYWDDEMSYYDEMGHDLYAYSHGIMLMALARAYALTDDESHKTRFDTIVTAMIEGGMYDDERGGFFNHLRADDRQLASNMSIVNGLLLMYEASGQEEYLTRSKDVLDFVEAELVAEDIYEDGWSFPGYQVAYHHHSPYEDRASHHCGGCNWFFLGNIYELNRIIYE